MRPALGTQQQWLESWLKAKEAEAPVLLIGTDERELERQVSKLAGREDIEVVLLPVEKPTIAIEELRKMFSAVARTALAGRRLIVIPKAERLSAPAANALLKSLEESTKANRFLLTSTNPRRLLSTIRSRCQQLWISSASEIEPGDEIEQLALGLGRLLAKHGPSQELKLAFMRLRDYFCIKSLRGNEKLAREVLFASLPDNIT